MERDSFGLFIRTTERKLHRLDYILLIPIELIQRKRKGLCGCSSQYFCPMTSSSPCQTCVRAAIHLERELSDPQSIMGGHSVMSSEADFTVKVKTISIFALFYHLFCLCFIFFCIFSLLRFNFTFAFL